MIAVALALCLAQDDLDDARLGRLPGGRDPSSSVVLLPDPELRAAVALVRRPPRSSFLLEGGVEVGDPLKWVGWKLPERASVLLAGPRDAPRLLVGGVERPVEGLRDAALLDQGADLALARATPGGVVVESRGAVLGPFQELGRLQEAAGELAFTFRADGARRLRWGDREYPVEGEAQQFQVSPRAGRRAWVERGADGALRVVLDGKASPPCRALVGPLTFSPDGRRACWVAQEGERGRAWIDGEPVEREASVAAVRLFNDGGEVLVEAWKEKQADKETEAWRARLVVRGRREDRVLPRVPYELEWSGGRWSGLSRGDPKSVLVSVGKDGTVAYEDLEGAVDRVVSEPGGPRRAWTVRGSDGVYVQLGGRRDGPYQEAEVFHLDFLNRFGYLARNERRVRLVVEERSWEVKLSEYTSPLRISRSQMTAAVFGFVDVGDGTELWRRVIELE